MAKYTVLVKSYINNALVEAGAVVEINDDPKKGGMKPGSNLEAVKAGKKDEAEASAEATQ